MCVNVCMCVCVCVCMCKFPTMNYSKKIFDLKIGMKRKKNINNIVLGQNDTLI